MSESSSTIPSQLLSLGLPSLDRLLNLFFDSVPFLMGLVEVKDGAISHVFLNRLAEKILKVSQKKAPGMKIQEHGISREEEKFWLDRYAEAKRNQTPVKFTFSTRSYGAERPDIWFEATVTHMGTRENGSDLYCYICEDVTEKRNLVDNLKAERERFQLAVDGANAGLWDWDLPTNRVYLSRQWKEMLGYAEEELPSALDTWKTLLHPDDSERCLKAVDDYLSGKTQEFQIEMRLRCRDGSYRWILSKGSQSRGPTGELSRFTGWHVDIHDLKSTVEELKRRDAIIREQQVKIITSAKMSSLGEMAGGIAHEINNPLAIIALSATQISDALHQKPQDTKLVDESLQKIQLTVKRIGKIVKGLRSFSRSGEKDPLEPTLVGQIVSDTLELCRERFRTHEIELKVSPIPSRTIQCRSVQVSQVLLNLLNNAFDAVKGQSEAWVEVNVTEGEKGLFFAVTDSGPGIPEELAPRIMEPFFTTKEVGAGTGLGLSISKGIVEDHGGTLELLPSTSPTTFVFFLPYRRQ